MYLGRLRTFFPWKQQIIGGLLLMLSHRCYVNLGRPISIESTIGRGHFKGPWHITFPFICNHHLNLNVCLTPSIKNRSARITSRRLNFDFFIRVIDLDLVSNIRNSLFGIFNGLFNNLRLSYWASLNFKLRLNLWELLSEFFLVMLFLLSHSNPF